MFYRSSKCALTAAYIALTLLDTQVWCAAGPTRTDAGQGQGEDMSAGRHGHGHRHGMHGMHGMPGMQGMPGMSMPHLSDQEKAQLRKEALEQERKLYAPYLVHGAADLDKSQADKAYQKGGALLAEGKLKEAIASLDTALKLFGTKEEKALYKDPRFLKFRQSRTYMTRAMCHMRLNDNESAEADLTDAIFFCSDYSMPYRMRAGVYKNLNRQEECLKDLAKASNLAPFPAFIEVDMRKMGMQGNFGLSSNAKNLLHKKFGSMFEDMAKRIYVDGMNSLKKSKMHTAYEKGRIARDDYKFEKAREYFTEAIKAGDSPEEKKLFKKPEYYKITLGRAYQNRAFCSLNLREFETAIKDLNQAIKLDPEAQENYINRGKAYQKLGKAAEARKDFDKAQSLTSTEVSPNSD